MRRGSVWRPAAELIPPALIVASMGCALALVITMHRRQAGPSRPKPAPVVVQAAPAPIEPAETAPPVSAAPAPVDPTPSKLEELSKLTSAERRAAEDADRRARELAATAEQAEKHAAEGRRREMLARNQIDSIEKGVATLEGRIDALARQRDVLSKRRDDLKLSVDAAKGRSGAAVLPYKGANGTWRLPIVIECVDGTATLQPGGPSFALVDLMMGGFGPRSSPLARAVAARLVKLQDIHSPDGAGVIPYIFFAVRPDGVRAYYEARTRLEPLGITFGYELIEQDWEIEFPDLIDVAEWSETAPLRGVPSGLASGSTADGSAYVWPSERPGAGRGPGSDSENGGDYIWPTEGPGSITPGRVADFAALEGLANNGVDALGEGSSVERLQELLRDGNGPHAEPFRRSTPGRAGGSAGGDGFEVGDLAEIVEPRPDGHGRLSAEPFSSLGSDSGSVPRGSRGIGDFAGMPGREQGRSGVPGSGRGASGFDGAMRGSRGGPNGGSPVRGDFGSGAVRPSPGDGRSGGPGSSGGLPGRPASGRSRNVGPFDERRLATGESLPKSSGLPPVRSEFTPSDGGTGSGGGSSGGSGRGTPGGTASGSGTSGSPPSSGLSLAGDGSAGGEKVPSASELDQVFKPRRDLELIVACTRGGVVVQPGGYVITRKGLDSKDALLAQTLRSLVRRRERSKPDVEWRPRVRFLVEPGGEAAYAIARKQTVHAELPWPMQLQFAEGTPLRIAEAKP